MKKILIICLVITLCLSTLTGCVIGQQGDNPDEITEPTPEPQPELVTPDEQIEESVLLYPAKNATFRYNVYTHYIEIVQCLSAENHIVVPDYIEGKPVYVIAAHAFQDRTSLTTCELTSQLVEIGEKAFSGCTMLESIKLPPSILRLGNSVFADCTSLLSMNIPSNISVIPRDMCAGCLNLRTVNIEPGGVRRTIEGGAFRMCESLTNIWIPSAFTKIDGYIIDLPNGESPYNLTMYGEPSSQAAHYAADNFIDYVVLSPREFAQLAQATLNDAPVINTTIKGANFEITLQQATHITTIDGYTIPADHKMLQLVFKVRSTTGRTQETFFNPLFITASANGGQLPISFVTDKIGDYQLLGGPLNGGDEITGFICIEVPDNWTTLKIDFKDCDDFSGQTMFRLMPQHITNTTIPNED